MSLVLHVDGERWRAAHDRFVADHPGVVPVIKGNGYGFGRDLLCAEAPGSGVPMVAVGTYAELPSALAAFGGDVLVMEPFRAAIHSGLPDLAHRRLVHTVTKRADLEACAPCSPDARVVVEGLTSMNRFGAPAADVGELAADGGRRGRDAAPAARHRPRGGDRRLHRRRPRGAALVRLPRVGGRARDARERHTRLELLPRIGTDLWYADPGSYAVRAHVLDVRPVAKGTRVGYRQRPLPPGTSSSSAAARRTASPWRARRRLRRPGSRAIAVAEGVLEAAHRVRSPFTVSGTMPRFAEPPHMQCSLLALPEASLPRRSATRCRSGCG